MKNIGYQTKEKLKNKKNIFKFISNKSEFNKQEISDALQISFPTVTKFIEEFIKEGIIQEIKDLKGQAKRRATTYRYNPNSFFSIGIQLEVNRISFVLINLDGKEINKKEIQKNFFNKLDLTEYIISLLKNFLINFSHKEKIKGIGISLPGIVNNSTKTFEIGTNFKLFSKDMKLIEKELNMPVYLINEANAGALGEYILGDRENSSLAFISIDTGIGAGIIINDCLYEGKNFKAGEFGHFTVRSEGNICNCGNKGCLETYCSNLSLIRDFEEAFNLNNLELIEIFSKNLHLHPQGKDILNKYIDYLGNALRSFQLIFDVDKIIIGGEICLYKDYFNFEEKIKEIMFNNIFLNNKDILEFSKYYDSSNILGAALFPFKDFYFSNLESTNIS